MFLGNDSFSAALASAKDQDLKPLTEECSRTLDLDRDQLAMVASYLHDAWFFGIRTGHAVMVETKMGRTDPAPVITAMQGEFQDLMESLAEELDATVSATITAWTYLGRAWIAGARFWEVEIAARLIEASAESFEEGLRRLRE